MSSSFLAGGGSLDGISLPIAVLAGLVSFVSPCVLPLVPAYLAYLGARAGQPVAATAAGGVGPAAPDSGSQSLAVAGVFVIAVALHVAGLIRLPFVDREYRVMDRAPSKGGVAGGFVLGMGFASGWTPCIGVTLSAVLSSAVTAGTTAQGLGLMVAYCLGLGVPFIVLALLLEKTRPLLRMLNSHRRAIDLVSAAVLVAMGLLLLTNKLAILSAGITQLVPGWP